LHNKEETITDTRRLCSKCKRSSIVMKCKFNFRCSYEISIKNKEKLYKMMHVAQYAVVETMKMMIK